MDCVLENVPCAASCGGDVGAFGILLASPPRALQCSFDPVLCYALCHVGGPESGVLVLEDRDLLREPRRKSLAERAVGLERRRDAFSSGVSVNGRATNGQRQHAQRTYNGRRYSTLH